MAKAEGAESGLASEMSALRDQMRELRGQVDEAIQLMRQSAATAQAPGIPPTTIRAGEDEQLRVLRDIRDDLREIKDNGVRVTMDQ